MIENSIKCFLLGKRYSHTTINYDMNAIKIRLYEDNSDERYLFLYIYSPWRIVKENKIINSSALYPFEGNYDLKEEHDKEFLTYCNSTSSLAKRKIVEITIKKATNDLIIRWDDGTLLEKFCFEVEDYDYHIYDNLNAFAYDVCFNKIEQEAIT